MRPGVRSALEKRSGDYEDRALPRAWTRDARAPSLTLSAGQHRRVHDPLVRNAGVDSGCAAALIAADRTGPLLAVMPWRQPGPVSDVIPF